MSPSAGRRTRPNRWRLSVACPPAGAYDARRTYIWGTGLLYRAQGAPPAFRPSGTFASRTLTDRDAFVDPCGDGTFTADNGDPVFGPAHRSLDLLPVRLRDGRLHVDLNPYKAVQRQPGQPAPAVPA